jgi:hypothetical protein
VDFAVPVVTRVVEVRAVGELVGGVVVEDSVVEDGVEVSVGVEVLEVVVVVWSVEVGLGVAVVVESASLAAV